MAKLTTTTIYGDLTVNNTIEGTTITQDGNNVATETWVSSNYSSSDHTHGVGDITDISSTDLTNWDSAYTHVSSNGSDHSYINQSVTTTSTPSFDGIDFNNLENTNGNSGNVAYDASEGLLIYKTIQPGDASGNDDYVILDGSNISAGNGISITGGSGSSGAPVTFSLSGDTFNSSGTYTNLRAQGTLKGDVGLGNVPNSSDLSDFTNDVGYYSSGDDIYPNSVYLSGSTPRVNTGGITEWMGGTSSFYIGVQDGNGRVQMKWNATEGTGETYLVDNESATKWHMDRTQVLECFYAPGGNAGDTISWTKVFDVDGSGNVNATGNISSSNIGTAADRDYTISTSDPSGGADGDVWYKV